MDDGQNIAPADVWGLEIPLPRWQNTRLSPEGAERVTDRMRRRVGLGQAYHLHVELNDKGDWLVDDGKGDHVVLHPMGASELLRWYTTRYADAIAEHLETSEG